MIKNEDMRMMLVMLWRRRGGCAGSRTDIASRNASGVSAHADTVPRIQKESFAKGNLWPISDMREPRHSCAPIRSYPIREGFNQRRFATKRQTDTRLSDGHKVSAWERDLVQGDFLGAAQDPLSVKDRATHRLDLGNESIEQVVVVLRAQQDFGHSVAQRTRKPSPVIG